MHIYFLGVTTKQSAMTLIMPLWADALNMDLKLIGIDLPLNADPVQYQNTVLEIKNDREALGSVVTSHKVSLFEHAACLFDEFDAMTELSKEIATIAKRGSLLAGLAKSECMSTTLTLKSMLTANYWRIHQTDVLCFGAGGVGRAIALSLLCDFESNSPLTEPRLAKPRRLILVDIDQQKLSSVKALLDPFRDTVEIRYICQFEAEKNDRLLADLPAGSLVINATGMGKDLPGSPLTENASFPAESIVWDLNYRGERFFLQLARSQEIAQRLQIHDGWQCFMHGWTQTLQIVLQQQFSLDQFERLSKIAEPFRTN